MKIALLIFTSSVKSFARKAVRSKNLIFQILYRYLLPLTHQATMDTIMTDGSNSRQGNVQVYLTTKFPDIELAEGKRQLLVPTSELI